MLKREKRDVVSETPETPKLGVRPFLRPPVKEAVSQSFVMVTVELFATLGPLPLVLIDSPVLAERVSVGVSSSLYI